ncbi:unnamed protein product [Chironomus riparius]|uniref:PNPLA domain-containing protein n=1 Tax=Chironomus riparius TaxID=315576 RepID=A0A9N9S916_9DIPT|nr:unnamed protein product [Chironomus riparius]
MFKLFNRNLFKQCRVVHQRYGATQKLSTRTFHYDQSKYHYLITSVGQNKANTTEQLQFLEVLVRTIETERQMMYPQTQQLATNLLVELQNETREVPCEVLQENCRLGLALLGYSAPIRTEYLRILTIDGGGIRGILVIEMLKKLEELTGKRIFDLFDFICGVSTGSIVVCGLTADPLRTLSEGQELYKEVSRKVFHLPGTLDVLSGTSRLMWTHAYYDVDLWEKLLKQTMTDMRIIDTSRFANVKKFCCVSTTVSDDSLDAHVFRNYVLPWNVESIYHGSHTAALWEVVRCSSAAPTYFGDFILNNQVHQDGGVLYNNPSCVAIHEAKLLWPNQKLCLVSLGTGRSPNKRKMDSQKLYTQKQMQSLFKDTAIQTSSWKTKFLRILDAATDTEQTHHILSDLMEPGTYFRFNPYLTNMVSMTECNKDKLAQLEKDALMYYRRNEQKFEELAEMLLKPRTGLTAINDFLFN